MDRRFPPSFLHNRRMTLLFLGLALGTTPLAAQLPAPPYVGTTAYTYSGTVADSSTVPPITYHTGGCNPIGFIHRVPSASCAVAANQGLGYTATATANAAYNQLSYSATVSSVSGTSPTGGPGSFAGAGTLTFFRDVITVTGAQQPSSLVFHISDPSSTYSATLGTDAIAAADSAGISVFVTSQVPVSGIPNDFAGGYDLYRTTTPLGTQTTSQALGSWQPTSNGGVVTYFAPTGTTISQFDFELVTGSNASLYFGSSSHATAGTARVSVSDPWRITGIDALDASGNPLAVRFSAVSGVDYGLPSSTVPEPSVLLLTATGFVGLGAARRGTRTHGKRLRPDRTRACGRAT